MFDPLLWINIKNVNTQITPQSLQCIVYMSAATEPILLFRDRWLRVFQRVTPTVPDLLKAFRMQKAKVIFVRSQSSGKNTHLRKKQCFHELSDLQFANRPSGSQVFEGQVEQRWRRFVIWRFLASRMFFINFNYRCIQTKVISGQPECPCLNSRKLKTNAIWTEFVTPFSVGLEWTRAQTLCLQVELVANVLDI